MPILSVHGSRCEAYADKLQNKDLGSDLPTCNRKQQELFRHLPKAPGQEAGIATGLYNPEGKRKSQEDLPVLDSVQEAEENGGHAHRPNPDVESVLEKIKE